MHDLNPTNHPQREALIARGVKVQLSTDHGKFYCHIGERDNDLPPVYKDTADEAFETAFSNDSLGTGKLSG